MLEQIPTIIKYSDKKAILEFSQSYVLLNSVCSIDLDFNGTDALEEAVISFEFTDVVPQGKKPLDVDLKVTEGGKRATLYHYQWYGVDIESTNPYELSSSNGKVWHIKLSTTADKALSRRTVNISIWRLL